MNDKYIELNGASNFRDLGGYLTSNGKIVKKGNIFRSDHLSHLTNEDLEKVKALGIKTVCDFRSDEEVEIFPSVFDVDSEPYLLRIPIKTLGNQDLQRLAEKENVTSQELADALQEHYVLYVNQHKERYKFFLNTLAYKDIPIVFHCFAGKDRTGFGALLFLSILGVSKELIIEDYLLTNVFYKGPKINDWRETTSDAIRPLLEARTDYIDAAFNEIEGRHENVEQYVLKELEIGGDTITLIKDRYLE